MAGGVSGNFLQRAAGFLDTLGEALFLPDVVQAGIPVDAIPTFPGDEQVPVLSPLPGWCRR